VADLSSANWRKSTRSQANGDCVEFAELEDAVAVRDSKNPERPALIFTRREWLAFIAGAKDGEFDI
jgi:Domain of unknown function (DUF397)